MEYSAKEAAEHCDCAYCRNFYAAVDSTYPELRPFLAQFGVDIEAPEELMPYTPVDCEGAYFVFGRILCPGNYEIDIGRAHVLAQACEDRNGFLIQVMDMHFPWVLDEPMVDVISPANEPSFLKKMWERLLGKNKKNIPYS